MIVCASCIFASIGCSTPARTSSRSRTITARPKIRQQLVVRPHQLVRNRHQLAEHFARRLGDSDIIPQALRHFPLAIEPHENRHRQRHFGRLPVFALDVAMHQQIEFLLGRADFDVRFAAPPRRRPSAADRAARARKSADSFRGANENPRARASAPAGNARTAAPLHSSTFSRAIRCCSELRFFRGSRIL